LDDKNKGKKSTTAPTHGHSGHRARMRKRFLDNFGFEGFEPHEILEVLLYYAIPRADTNPLAHKLLDDFGSLASVFDAPIDALRESGCTESCAVFLNLVPHITRVYYDDKYKNHNKIVDLDNIGEHLRMKFIGRDNEVVVLLLLDAKGKELFSGVVSNGSVNSADMPIRNIVSLALRFNAARAIVAHNHPSGVAIPSREDITVTAQIKDALALVGVRLSDHIIYADNDYISLADSEYDVGIFVER
jgi:DNA repair protein RadC